MLVLALCLVGISDSPIESARSTIKQSSTRQCMLNNASEVTNLPAPNGSGQTEHNVSSKPNSGRIEDSFPSLLYLLTQFGLF